MEIWKLPASEKLGAQTLDKLSLAPWRLLKGDAATNGAPSAQLRLLLDDLVQSESYLEIRNATNLPGELAFAIRLDPERAGLWETNLATVLESLTGIRPVPATGGRPGWALKKHDQPQFVELSRAGDWTLLGLSPGENGLLDEFRARIGREHAPFAAHATNYWLEADLDLRRIGSALALGWHLPEELPAISATVAGDGRNVNTRGQLNFSKPLTLELEPWNIPTNLIHDPLISFTAIRSLRPWLASLNGWNSLEIGQPPNQVYFWAMDGPPVQTYFAAPLPDASNQVHAAAELLIQNAGLWVATNAVGSFVRATNFNGAIWAGVPFMSSFLRSVKDSGGGLAFGGLFPNSRTNLPTPAALLAQIVDRTNLVAYDWEFTRSRIDGWIYIGQMFRLICNRAQLPPESASMVWLKALMPAVGNCGTSVAQTGPNQLSIVRNSSVGFTAVELHSLADWLESPQFPCGLHTTLAPRPPALLPPPKE